MNAPPIPSGRDKMKPELPTPMSDVLLHSCCAPCSSAILEWPLKNGRKPTVFYFNPNIFPEAEYLLRKNEAKRWCEKLGVPFVDGDYDHDLWRRAVKGLENEPERGRRCRVCFGVRMEATAQMAEKLGIPSFTTTLAGSRWKRLEQIREAALEAAERHPGTSYWDMNWRKGGLQQRRGEIIAEEGFYNQLWCGCEFSMGHLATRDPMELPEHVRHLIPMRPPAAEAENAQEECRPDDADQGSTEPKPKCGACGG